MSASISPTTLFLKPGEWFFGQGHGELHTILGSCVSLLLWQPQIKVIALSHALLPKRSRHSDHEAETVGRFVEEITQLFLQKTRKFAVPLPSYHAHIFGGGDMFPDIGLKNQIGLQNIQMTKQLLEHAGVPILSEDIGGTFYRRLKVNCHTGRFHVEKAMVNCFDNN